MSYQEIVFDTRLVLRLVTLTILLCPSVLGLLNAAYLLLRGKIFWGRQLALGAGLHLLGAAFSPGLLLYRYTLCSTKGCAADLLFTTLLFSPLLIVFAYVAHWFVASANSPR
jgi:hypothetical protein